MIKLKTLVLATALLAGGTSLAMAQSDVAGAGGHVTTSAAAADNPPVPSRTTRHHGTTHHKMYMSAKSTRHQNTSKMNTKGGY